MRPPELPPEEPQTVQPRITPGLPRQSMNPPVHPSRPEQPGTGHRPSMRKSSSSGSQGTRWPAARRSARVGEELTGPTPQEPVAPIGGRSARETLLFVGAVVRSERGC